MVWLRRVLYFGIISPDDTYSEITYWLSVDRIDILLDIPNNNEISVSK